ncbi:hypothetical protein [Streptomyces sp. NPDC049040]|uniref:hypothetical protein n=1 Tax=Streptomyces sp. NPDC049040 TaxID=3365593 RepID=UPI0037189AC5
MPESTAGPWIRRRTTRIGIVLLVCLIWSVTANRWSAKGCDAIPQSYVLAVTHFGAPGHYEGCEDEPGGPQYTDDYDG